MASKLNLITELLILKQTLFALPFAYIGVLLAGISPNNTMPGLSVWILVTAAMIFARTAGMSLNRIIDRKIDAENPRTKDRILPSGRLSVGVVWALAIVSLFFLVLCSFLLNDLCFYLSPFAALLLFGYSYCKRFTWFSHFVLGIVEAFAPIGGWFAVTGKFDWRPMILGLLIIFWMAGLDIIYSCQDYIHDKKSGLYSIPSKFGLYKALLISRVSHFICMLCVISIGLFNPLSYFFWFGAVLIGLLFIYEHSLVSPQDLTKVKVAFFKVNSIIAVVLVCFIGLDIVLMKVIL